MSEGPGGGGLGARTLRQLTPAEGPMGLLHFPSLVHECGGEGEGSPLFLCRFLSFALNLCFSPSSFSVPLIFFEIYLYFPLSHFLPPSLPSLSSVMVSFVFLSPHPGIPPPCCLECCSVSPGEVRAAHSPLRLGPPEGGGDCADGRSGPRLCWLQRLRH